MPTSTWHTYFEKQCGQNIIINRTMLQNKIYRGNRLQSMQWQPQHDTPTLRSAQCSQNIIVNRTMLQNKISRGNRLQSMQWQPQQDTPTLRSSVVKTSLWTEQCCKTSYLGEIDYNQCNDNLNMTHILWEAVWSKHHFEWGFSLNNI